MLKIVSNVFNLIFVIVLLLQENNLHLQRGLNPGPLDYEHDTQPTELMKLDESCSFLLDIIAVTINVPLYMNGSSKYRSLHFFPIFAL